MSRKQKIIRNILIISLIVFIFFPLSGLYINPISAHRASERSAHYGPSKVTHVEDFDGGKYILGKYDKWASCNTINRSLLFFWRFGNQVTGFEQDINKPIDYTWGMTDEVYYKLYGVINDKRIEKVELTLKNGEVLTTTDFYEDMFLITWENKNTNKQDYLDFKIMRGYDSNGNIIYEDKHPNY